MSRTLTDLDFSRFSLQRILGLTSAILSSSESVEPKSAASSRFPFPFDAGF